MLDFHLKTRFSRVPPRSGARYRAAESTDPLSDVLLGKQSFIFLLDDRVTFAGSLLEARAVQHGDATARVPDQSRIL